jgi:adenylate cyclase
VRHVVAGVVLGLLSAGIVLAAAGWLQTVELKTYDWRLVRTAQPDTASHDIALVAIDEYSLRNLQKNAGRWPWPRAVHSLLIDYLAKAPAKLVVYDVDFAEADTRRGFNFGGDTWSGAESDQAFVDSVKAAGNVLLLADATYEGESSESVALSDAGFHVGSANLATRSVVFPPFPALARAAAGLGHNLFVLDADGPLRHTIPFVRTGSIEMPSLGLAAALRAMSAAPSQVRIEGEQMRVGSRVMPLQSRRVDQATYLWGLIDFRGPAHTYLTYSFYDLEYSLEQMLAGLKPNIDPSIFRNKVVFVGVTATGLHDVFETPFAQGRMAGSQVHAAVADDILTGHFLAPASNGVRVVSVLLGAAVVGCVATLLPAWWATGLGVAAAVGFVAAATRLFAGGYWLNVSQPVLAGAIALFAGVAYQYFVEGREKRVVKRLFGRYVSKDVYEQLVADPALARLGGDRREMTVLFSDIRGFTTVSESAEPETIVHLLNEYLTAMVAIVFRHHGTVDKFVGDAVMALFGAPLDDPQHADHAADAALDMLAELQRLNMRWAAEGRPQLDIGIGINTGPMIAGNIGSDQIMSYTVIGDAVNLGARLESLNKEYATRIIISEATRERLTGPFHLRPLGDVVVKGKRQAVAVHELVGRRDAIEVQG